MSLPKYLLSLLATAIGLAALFVINFAPLSTTSHLLATTDLTQETIVLLPGHILTQTYSAYGNKQSGVDIYTTTPVLTDQKLQVVILDKQKTLLAQGKLKNKTYLPADDSVILHYSFPWLSTSPNQSLSLQLTLTQGNRLPLRYSIKNTYGHGHLYLDNTQLDGDLALATTHPAPLSFGAKQGATVAIALVILFSLIITYLPPAKQWWATALTLTLFTPLAIFGFTAAKHYLGIADWDLYFSYHEVIRRTILNYHVFPFWNPWLCGGTAALADPEFPLFTFTFLLELIFGIPVGFPLAIFLSVAVTAVGMLLLAKHLRLSLPAALLAALAGSFGSVSLLEIVEGHPNVFSAMWIPWIFLSWLIAYQRNATLSSRQDSSPSTKLSFILATTLRNPWLLICGIFLAMTFYAGGIYLLMYTGLALTLITFLVSRPFLAFRTTFISGLWGLSLAALKLVPVLFWLRQFQDKNYASSAATLPFLTDILLGRYLHGADVIFSQASGWHEYGAYLGYFVLGLAILGLSQIRQSRLVRSLAIAALAAILLSSAGPALKPYFDQLPWLPRSNISRFILFAIIPLSLLAGFGLDTLRSKLQNRQPGYSLKSSLVSIILIGFVAVDLLSLSYQLSQQAFVLPQVVLPPPPAPYPIAYSAYRFNSEGTGNQTPRSYTAIQQGYGTLTYCSVLGPDPMVRTIHDEVDNGIILAKPTPRQITLTDWTPNQASFFITADQPTQLVLNTNYATGWTVNGQPTTNSSGRVAVTVPSGTYHLTFRYQTAGFKLGLVITLLALVFAFYQAYYYTKHKK